MSRDFETPQAATLRELGFGRATDLIGGFNAWKMVGLPVRPAREHEEDGVLIGMGEAEPVEPTERNLEWQST